MTGWYEIFQGSNAIGRVEVSREGLYYRFRCSCSLTGSVMCKVVVRMGENSRELGILAPKNGAFCLETKVPVKYFGSNDLRFETVPYFRSEAGQFIPISPEEPFAYLSRLRYAHMERRNGQIGIVLK